MSKRGQHNGDLRDQDTSKGHNNPSQSMTITTGNYKKPETYDEQARNHEDTGKQAQAAKNDWHEAQGHVPTPGDSPRARDSDIGRGRSGSDSNASNATKGH